MFDNRPCSLQVVSCFGAGEDNASFEENERLHLRVCYGHAQPRKQLGFILRVECEISAHVGDADRVGKVSDRHDVLYLLVLDFNLCIKQDDKPVVYKTKKYNKRNTDGDLINK